VAPHRRSVGVGRGSPTVSAASSDVPGGTRATTAARATSFAGGSDLTYTIYGSDIRSLVCPRRHRVLYEAYLYIMIDHIIYNNLGRVRDIVRTILLNLYTSRELYRLRDGSVEPVQPSYKQTRSPVACDTKYHIPILYSLMPSRN